MIGLFLREEIPRGMSFADTVAAIRAQGGLVYLPHPFDRMHAIPDPATLHRHLAEIDVFEVYNARLLFEAYNDEALRFARKYNLTIGRRLGRARAPGRRHRRGADARASSGPEEFLVSACDSAEILRRPKSLAYLQCAQVGGASQGESALGEPTVGAHVTVATDEIYEKYLQKAITEINDSRRRDRAGGRRRARAGRRLRAIRSPTSCCSSTRRAASELQEGVAFFGRAGQAILKSLQRLHVDPMAIYGTNCLKFAGRHRGGVAPVSAPRAAHRPAEARRRHGRAGARVPERRRASRSRGRSSRTPASCSTFTPTIEALYAPDIDASLDEQPEKTRFWNAFKPLGEWWESLPPY